MKAPLSIHTHTKKKDYTHNLVTEEKQPVKLGDDNKTIVGQGRDIIIIISEKAAPTNDCSSHKAPPESEAVSTL